MPDSFGRPFRDSAGPSVGRLREAAREQTRLRVPHVVNLVFIHAEIVSDLVDDCLADFLEYDGAVRREAFVGTFEDRDGVGIVVEAVSVAAVGESEAVV